MGDRAVLYLNSYHLAVVKQLINASKFSGKKGVLEIVINRACGYLFQGRGQSLTLVPVPQSRLRFAGRGYNQAELIAKYLAIKYHLPVSNCLAESSRVVPSHKKNRTNRLEQQKNIIYIDHLPTNSAVILVDDVLTTGSTAAACTRILEEAGHRVLAVTVLAYTKPKHQSLLR